MLDGIQKLIGELSDKMKAHEIGSREVERRLLDVIGHELDEDQLDRPSYLAAFAESEGNPDKARALYIKHRLQRLIDELEAHRIRSNQSRKEAANRVNISFGSATVQPTHTKAPIADERSDPGKGGRVWLALIPIAVIVAIALMIGSSNKSASSSDFGEANTMQYDGEVAVAPSTYNQPARNYDQFEKTLDAYHQSMANAEVIPEVAASSGPEPMFKTSFDCFGAHLSVERQICGSAVLASKDVTMAKLYTNLLPRLYEMPRRTLEESQSNWLTERNLCEFFLCISDKYDSRIVELENISNSLGTSP